MTETTDALLAELALLREQVAQRVARLNELRARDLCDCGHTRSQHGQGCEVSGCHCPYFERPNPADLSPACKPKVTPTSPVLSDYERGFQAGRDAAAAANLKQGEQVVELGPRTLRALVAALLYDPGQLDAHPGWVTRSHERADKLLAELAHTEEK